MRNLLRVSSAVALMLGAVGVLSAAPWEHAGSKAGNYSSPAVRTNPGVVYYSAPVAQQPTVAVTPAPQAVTGAAPIVNNSAPATTNTAQANTNRSGYRSYSYQPGRTLNNGNSSRRFYQRADSKPLGRQGT
jgi:hypothetical protein